MQGLEVSEIVRISETAAWLRAQGRDVVALSTGEPDFPTPSHVIEAAHAAALAGKTRYTPTVGAGDLRAAIAALAGDGLSDANVIVSTGAKQVLGNAFLATLNPGDEVVMAAPFWTSYADMVRLAGGVPVTVPCPIEAGFKLTPAALERALSPRTRWLLLNSPANPTGAVYSRDEMAALAAVLERAPQVWVIADEIYQHLSFVPFLSFAEAVPALRDRTLIVNGVSKAYSMTGWRIGWGIGPGELIRAMTAVQGQSTSGACSVAQAAALAALTGDQTLLDARREILRARRDRVVADLNATGRLDCPVPEGAFYVFPSCASLLAADKQGGFDSDAELCRYLLETAGVAVVPGRAFGLPGHFRLSFAYSEDDLAKGLGRLRGALEELQS